MYVAVGWMQLLQVVVAARGATLARKRYGCLQTVAGIRALLSCVFAMAGFHTAAMTGLVLLSALCLSRDELDMLVCWHKACNYSTPAAYTGTVVAC